MNPSMPRRVSVSSQKIAELVFEKIFPVMQGEPLDAMVLSLFAAAALAMHPNLPTPRLQSVIVDTSGYLANLLQDEVPAEDAN